MLFLLQLKIACWIKPSPPWQHRASARTYQRATRARAPEASVGCDRGGGSSPTGRLIARALHAKETTRSGCDCALRARGRRTRSGDGAACSSGAAARLPYRWRSARTSGAGSGVAGRAASSACRVRAHQRARCWVVALTWKSARTLREKKQQTNSRARALRERDKPNQPHCRDTGPMSGP
jgi:hypothetical protein